MKQLEKKNKRKRKKNNRKGAVKKVPLVVNMFLQKDYTTHKI